MQYQQSDKNPLKLPRACDGDIQHPGHAQFHILRLLIGSIIGGWTLVLVFFAIGFMGNIRFVQTMDLAFDWLLYGGTTLGIILGLLFSIISALLLRLLPILKRTTHPLALVRTGFLLISVWALLAFAFWPATIWGFILAPMFAFVVGLEGIRVNPFAELVPHSTSGRVLGTAIGPFVIMAVLLMVLIPMLQRGYGNSYSPKLVMVAVDGIDGIFTQEILNSDEKENYPNLLEIRENGGIGIINTTPPLVPSRAWADLMTGQEWDSHGILDRHSTSDELTAYTLWDILAMRGYSVGLFQMLPPHEINRDFGFDIPAPGTSEGERALSSSALDSVRSMGKLSSLPGIEESVLAACYLARFGVTLETLTDLFRQYVLETLTDPSPGILYLNRKLLEFRIESDIAVSQVTKHHVDAAFLRFTSLEELFLAYWRYSYPGEFGPIPAGIDSATAYGLSKTLPDALHELDAFIGKLEPFITNQTILAVVSNHGVRSATDIRNQDFHLSPGRLVQKIGLPDIMVADYSANGIVIRIPGQDTSSPEMTALENALTSARWSNERPENPDNHTGQPIFTITRHDECLEVALRYFSGISKDIWISTLTQTIRQVEEFPQPETPMSSTMTGLAYPATGDPEFDRSLGREPFPERDPYTMNEPWTGYAETPDSDFIHRMHSITDLPASGTGPEDISIADSEIISEVVVDIPEILVEEENTVGGWQGYLGEILVQGEQPSGRINGSAFFMIDGPHFAVERTAGNHYLFDIAPTILHALGIELSEDLDGHTMDELFRPAWLTNNLPVYIETYTPSEPPPPPEPAPEFSTFEQEGFSIVQTELLIMENSDR